MFGLTVDAVQTATCFATMQPLPGNIDCIMEVSMDVLEFTFARLGIVVLMSEATQFGCLVLLHS